jgi:pimeloyl-ACP methyl ester carboxylesterase
MIVAMNEGCCVRMGGAEGGPLLLLLPGFGDNGSMFDGMFETALLQRFRLCAVDLPGFGGSPRNDDTATLAGYGARVASIARSVSKGALTGFVGHSVASIIAAHAATDVHNTLGVFSIEGNLTASDAYFSGKAAEYSDATQFKTAFIRELSSRAVQMPILHRYIDAVSCADPSAMWELGRDAKMVSDFRDPGEQLLGLNCPLLYYWSPANTPDATKAWIARQRSFPNRVFENGSHWPTVDQPRTTAEAIFEFFAPLT